MKMERFLVCAVASLSIACLLVSCRNGNNEQSSASGARSIDGANKSLTSSSEENDPDKALKDNIRAFLTESYPADSIKSVSLAPTHIDVKILTDFSANDRQPSDWDNIVQTAKSMNLGILSACPEGTEQTSAIMYLIDADNNNLLTVKDGEVSYSTFSGANSVDVPTDNPNTITMDEFNAIKTGMTYQEVFDIVGGRGETISESDIGLGDEYYTVMYEWQGEGIPGANANVMFQGGKVVNKAQFGLE